MHTHKHTHSWLKGESCQYQDECMCYTSEHHNKRSNTDSVWFGITGHLLLNKPHIMAEKEQHCSSAII